MPSDAEIFLSWDQPAQRAAFYAGVYRRGTFPCGREVALRWLAALPAVLDAERERLALGGLPRRLDVAAVLGP